MSSKYLFPSMDTDGWVTTSTKVADYLISHFFLSEKSQSALFQAKVYSFPWILHEHQGDLIGTMNETQSQLSTLFSTQFSEVEVAVSELPEENSINAHGLTIYLTFKDENGETFNLSRLIKYTGMKVTEIIAVINQG